MTSGGSTTTYSYNAASELTSAGSTTYQYDPVGNRIAGGSTASQSRHREDRPGRQGEPFGFANRR